MVELIRRFLVNHEKSTLEKAAPPLDREAPFDLASPKREVFYGLFYDSLSSFVYESFGDEIPGSVLLLLYPARANAEAAAADLLKTVSDPDSYSGLRPYAVELYDAMKVVEQVPLTPRTGHRVVGIICRGVDSGKNRGFIHLYWENDWYLWQDEDKDMLYLPGRT